MAVAASVLALAAAQHGVISRAQMLVDGMSPRTVDRMVAWGELVRILPGVYQFPAAPETFVQRLHAAVLWAGAGAVVSHRAAVVLHGLEGFRGEVVELTLPRNSRPPSPWVVIHHSCALPPGHVTTLGGLPATTVARTLVDLGKVAGRAIVGRILDDAVRKRSVVTSEVMEVAAELSARGRRGPSVIRSLLAERDPTLLLTRSELEGRFLRLMRKAGLPDPIPQFELEVGDERLRIDFAFPAAKVAIECDGYTYHFGLASWHRDRERRNLLAQSSWRVWHTTWRDVVDRPRETIRWLQTISSQIAPYMSLLAQRTG